MCSQLRLVGLAAPQQRFAERRAGIQFPGLASALQNRVGARLVLRGAAAQGASVIDAAEQVAAIATLFEVAVCRFVAVVGIAPARIGEIVEGAAPFPEAEIAGVVVEDVGDVWHDPHAVACLVGLAGGEAGLGIALAAGGIVRLDRAFELRPLVVGVGLEVDQLLAHLLGEGAR
ncbi:MAG: hypothetical protein CFE32_17350, partial [Alphaproteobacteria bacterium PA3]